MFHKTALCGLTVCVTAQWWPLTCILNDIASHARVLNHNNGAPTINCHATTAGHAAYCGSLLVASGSSIPLHTKMSRWFNGIHRPILSPWISKLWLWLGFLHGSFESFESIEYRLSRLLLLLLTLKYVSRLSQNFISQNDNISAQKDKIVVAAKRPANTER